MKGAVAVGILLWVAACAGAGVEPEAALVGTWVGTSATGQEVTMTLGTDGTFAWSSRDLEGTWEADGTTLTFFYPETSSFCDGGQLTWEYELDGDFLTSDVVAFTCPAGEMRPVGPPSPDWHFERQSAP